MKSKSFTKLSILAVGAILSLLGATTSSNKAIRSLAQELPSNNDRVRIPTMSFYGDTSTQMGFNWATTYYNDTNLEVVREDDGNGFSSANVIRFKGTCDACKSSGEVGFIHRVLATGLTPNTTYKYRFGDAELNSWCETGSFTTSSNTNRDFSFVHLSDPQGWNVEHYNAYHVELSKIDALKPEFLCLTGDIVNNSWANHSPVFEQWEWAITNQWNILKNYPVNPVSGNHDAASYDFSSRFNLNQPSGEQVSGSYYSYTYEGVHFIALNTNDDGCTVDDASGLSEAQMNWLKEDLEANKDARLTIAMMHKGIFDAGSHCINKVEGEDYDIEYIRNEVGPLFSKYGVDLVLQGHDHLYSESYPIISQDDGTNVTHKKEVISTQSVRYGDDYIETYFNPKGTIYLNSGSASGSKYYEKANFDPNLIPIKNFSNPGTQMFTQLEIKGQTIISRTYTIDSKGNTSLYHTFAINASSGGQNEPTNENETNSQKGCSGSLLASGSLISLTSVVAIFMISKKRGKEDGEY